VSARPDTPDPEEQLLARARAGDEDAFAGLVTLHGDQVYGALRRFGLDGHEAEEVAQEVFLRAWRGLTKFESRARLSTWLYRIAFNEAQRRLSQRPPVPLVELPGAREPAGSGAEARRLSPEARALDHEFATLLERALGQLAPDRRTAVILRDIQGLSTAAAAEIVGVRPLSFKSRLHRGRMELRSLLAPYLELDEP
jgi:RNA polymerase sigma-70 factor (ECF subfamily)